MEAGPLPSGVVTFVLTDIEGSTRLLRRDERRYDDMQARHVELLRRAWAAHGGAHVSARGDSCLAAFGSAAAALAACADAQRALAAEGWPPEFRLRVRMGVHSGLASPREGDYVALAVHQAARVMAAAHGGQVLVSETTAADSGAGTGPAGFGLRPVGRYRLRDFDEPVRLFCLTGEGLDEDFPAVRAMPVDGHNLPSAPTSFVGREGDVADIVALLGGGRLLTLTGPGGVGKSRLAVEAARAAASGWPHGVWLVDLVPVQDPLLIGDAVATTVGAALGSGSDRWHDALDHLRKLATLLLLDNCEHLAADLSPLVAEVLSACPGVGVLATSREPLGIAHERVWRVNPLPVPDPDTTVRDHRSVPSVQLFVDRARSAHPGFALDGAGEEAVAQLCRRLDGLPLALELAAAQTAVLSVRDVLDGLDDRFRILRSRGRGVPDRQRTMDAVIGWSYRLLDPDEQAVLRRVAVFRSGFSRDAAVVAGGDLACDVVESLWSLVDKSLVAVDLTANATRYRLLETVRAYASRLLEEEGGTAAVADRLSAWWLERIGPWQRMDRECSGEIEVELDNLRALVPLVAVHAEERAQLLACAIGRHYYAVQTPRGGTDELSRYATELSSPSPARLSLLATLAVLLVRNGEIDAAREMVEEAELVQATVGGAPPWDEVAVERAAGEVALRSGDHSAAAGLARRTLERDLTAPGRARMLNLLAISSYFGGDVESAEAAVREELEVAQRLGDEHLMLIAEGNVAELAMRRGDARAAAIHQAASLELALALGRPTGVAYALIVAARLTADVDPARASRLHSKAERLLAENGHQLYDDDLSASQEMLETVRQKLGDADFALERDAGRSMTLLDATSLAREALAGASA